MYRSFSCKKFLLLLVVAAIAAVSNFSQTPTPRPLPPEFLKRRAAGAEFELGRIFLRQGRAASLTNAVKRFETAEQIYAEIGDRANAACATLGRGAAQAELGELSRATIAFRDAKAALRSIDGLDTNETALVKLGVLYDHLVGKRFLFDHKELAVKRPRRGFDKDGNRLDTRFSQPSERYYVQYLNQPFTVYVEPERTDTIESDPRFAGSDREPEPVSFKREVLAIWRLNGVESIEIGTHVKLMEAWSGVNPQVAAFFGKQAINQYQELRRDLKQTKPYDPRNYVNQLTEKYRVLADLLISLGRLTEADEVLQMLKEEEFADFVRRDATEIERLKLRSRLTPNERALIDRYLSFAKRAVEIGEQLRVLEDKKARGEKIGEDEERSLARLTTQTADANAAFKLFLEKELVNEIGTENAKTLAADRTLQNNVRSWGGNAVALTTVITENRYRVVLTTPTVQIDKKTDISAAVLNKKVSAFRKALQDPTVDPRPLGKQLYDILIKPIENEIVASGAKTLVWSLDGTLRYIPLAALSPDGKSYFVERYQNVVITPKTRERITQLDADWRALGVGVSEEQTVALPEYPGQRIKLDALPATRNELFSIIRDESSGAETGIIDGRRFLDADFTLDNFTSSLLRKTSSGRRAFTVVHIASHFRLGANWSSSFLLLGGGKLLTLEDMSRLASVDFHDVELATLSACNTALVTEAAGFEVDSLAESIQTKGGKAVLATLWSVRDESTASLMQSFYKAKKDDPAMSKADALQHAQKAMLAPDSEYSHPYYWSGFVLIGNWR